MCARLLARIAAVPGTLAVAPDSAMIDAVGHDCTNTKAMIFGEAPAFEEVLASAGEIERIVNHGPGAS